MLYKFDYYHILKTIDQKPCSWANSSYETRTWD